MDSGSYGDFPPYCAPTVTPFYNGRRCLDLADDLAGRRVDRLGHLSVTPVGDQSEWSPG
jgi:hypothetical protein